MANGIYKELNDMQMRFVNEYLIDFNAAAAAKRAGYKAHSAGSQGPRLLENEKVRSYLKKQIDKRAKRTEITADRVLQEIANIAFANSDDFVRIEEGKFGKTVKILASKDIPEDKKAAVAGVKEGANGIEVKLNDKVKALELVGKHLGMFNDKLDVSGNVSYEVVVKYDD